MCGYFTKLELWCYKPTGTAQLDLTSTSSECQQCYSVCDNMEKKTIKKNYIPCLLFIITAVAAVMTPNIKETLFWRLSYSQGVDIHQYVAALIQVMNAELVWRQPSEFYG